MSNSKSKNPSRYKKARGMLIFWALFIGLGAVAGSLGMLLDPTGKSMGMDSTLPYFKALPFADILFRDFTFSGFALLAVNGLTNLTAAGMIFARKRSGIILGGIFGITLMLWICIQFYMFPPNFMSTAYFFFGLAQAITGYAAWVFEKQESFTVDIADYPNIGTEPSRLVVYFSRMGYVRRLACEEANRTGAMLYEIKSTEKTDSTAGFWLCGRYGMHKWQMPIEELSIDISEFSHVTICTPVWVFSLAAPVRSFCAQTAGKIKQADYIIVHHQSNAYENVAREMDSLLGLRCTEVRSVRCREGSFRNVKAGD